MSNNTGRTFWDWLSENKSIALITVLFCFLLFGYGLYNNYIVRLPTGFSIEKGDTPASTSENSKENPTKVEAKPAKPKTKETENIRINNSEKPLKDKNSQVEVFTTIVVDGSKKISDVEIFCPNCIEKNVKTDENGSFTLKAQFSSNEEFWKSTITLSKGNKSITPTINWRDKSPEPIQF